MYRTWLKSCLFVSALILIGTVRCAGQGSPAPTPAVEICNDGKDNDGNGVIDCNDSFCNYPATVEKGCRCFDNVDNDGDGKIDAADTDCASFYGLTFVGSGSTCSITPPPGSAFSTIAAPQTSSQNTADTPAKVVVGDMNNDGMPDVVVTSKWNSTIQVVATTTIGGFSPGDVMGDFRTPGSKIFPKAGSNYVFEHEALIADIDKDKIGEMYAIVSERGGSPNNKPVRFFLVGFKYAVKDLIPLFDAVDLGPDRPGSPGIADFDGDGKAEVYLRNQIYAAESGKLLANAGGNWDTQVNAGPVAANILGDNKLELICGPIIYTVPNMSARGVVTLTVAKDMNTLGTTYYPKGYVDLSEFGVDQASTTSTADIDGDGFLDVLITGAINCSGNEASPCGNNITTIFYWNVQKNTLSTYAPPDPSNANGWTWGTGRINLGDANGDGKLEALFVSGSQLFCLGLDAAGKLKLLWVRTINDSLSGILGLTVYDFNNDGKPEIVYRDSQELVIVDGLTGATKIWSASCQSHTFTEGPVVADVNGDGNTDICTTCYTNAGSFDITKSTAQQQSLGQTRLYYSNTNAWLPTRRIWNQHGYYVTNINDNLTLPFPQIDPSLIFSNAPCPTGLPGPQRPLNLFMNQVPRLSKDGCPEFPAPDLTFTGDDPANPGVDSNGDGVYTPAVVVTPPICGDLGISAFFNIINNGDLPISDTVPVSFFNGDPTVASPAAQLLLSTNITISNLQIGQKLVTAPVQFNGPGTVFKLYIVLYNNGQTLPISLTGQSTKECSIANNVYSVTVSPDPFTATIEKIADNFKCINSAPDNGEMRAHIFKGGVEFLDYSTYAFQWYTGAGTTSPIPAPQGTAYNLVGVAEGTYTLVVTNTAKGCKSTPVSMTLIRTGNDPDITINVISDQTKCTPPNGQLQATIGGGLTGFTFEWYDVALTPLGITGPQANGLLAGSYVVRVSKDGCTKTSAPATVLGPQVADAQAVVLQNVVDCSNVNSGAVQADAYFNGVLQNPANYKFDWYFYNNGTGVQGSILPPINGTGQTRTGLAAGYYQAVVKDINTGCVSAVMPVVQVVNQTVIPTANITEISPQTSCDLANPNGVLQGDALIGGVVQNPAAFTFQWFKGDNTLPANLHNTVSGVNGQIANKVSGGGVYYTVKVTTANNCSATFKYIISENINIPVVTLTASNNSICNPALAASTYNGSVAASVTFAGSPVGSFTNYAFTWHNGSQITDPVIPVGSNQLPSLSQLNGGYYTVEAKRTDLGCNSVPVTVQVLNAPVLPAIVVTNTPSTNCTGPANGAESAVVDLGGGVTTTSGYTFKWYNGNSTAGTVAGNTPAISSLTGGLNYTVEVVNAATGCVNTSTDLLPDAKALPVVTLAVNPNSICDPTLTNPPVAFGGSVVASVTYKGVPVGSFADYAFQWHNGALVTDPVNGSSTTTSLLNVDGGFYTVTANIISLGCTSNPVTGQVINNQIFPVLTSTITPSTNCDPLLKNGQAAITNVDGLGTGSPYDFKWYDGNVVVPGSEKALTPTYSALQGGPTQLYTALVTNQSTGCQTNKTFQVPDNSVLPILSLVPSPNSVCDPLLTNPPKNYGGSVAATVTNQVGLISNYTFAWHDGGLVTDPIDGSSTGPNLSNKSGGDYTVTTEHTPTGCISSPATATVVDNPLVPVITTATVASTNCDPLLKNGQASVSDVDGAGVGAPYLFQWYDGNVVVPGSEKSLIATYANVQGGVAGDYTVQVTNQNNGCQNNTTVQVPDQKTLPVLTLTGTDNTNCSIGKNGTADVATLTYQAAGVPAPYAGYTFSWSNGATTSAISGVAAGTYTLVATNTSVGCSSTPTPFDVNDNLFIPPINITPTPQTSCDVANPNGILTGTVDETSIGGGAAATAGYTFTWHSGTDTSDPVVTTTTATPGQVDRLVGNQDYLLEAVRALTGCSNTKSIFLTETIVYPSATFTTVNPLTRCDTPNGSVTATVAQVPVQTYTFFWMQEQPLTTTTSAATVIATVNGSPAYPNRKNTGPVAGTTDVFSNLIPGDYTVAVVDNFTTCVSQPVTATVIDNSLKSVITITLGPTFPSTCGIADGQMSALVGGGVGPYNIEWHRSGPTNSNINFFTNPPVFTPPNNVPLQTDLATTTSALNNVGSDTYTLVVKDVGNGCGNYKTTFLPFLNSHTITPIITPSTICPVTIGNGNLKATVGNIAAGKTFQDYTYALYSGENPDPTKQLGATIGPGAAVTNPQNFASVLAPGKYTIEVRQAFSGNCPVYDVVDILQNALAPVVTQSGTITSNTACDVLQADGSVSIDIQKDPDDVTIGSTYTLNVSPAPVSGGPYPVSGLATGIRTIPGMKPGGTVPLYTITVTSSNNCVTQRTFTIPDLPQVSNLVAGNITVTDADLCSPSGSAEVTAISMVGGGADNINNYLFDWFSDITLATNVRSAQGDNTATKGGEVLDNTTFATIGPGSYWVVATKNAVGQPGFGCTSAPFKADIADVSVNPTASLAPFTNTACDTNYEGKITVTAGDPSGPGVGKLYTYAWDPANPVAIASTTNNNGNAINDGDGDNPLNLKEGLYKVKVTNNFTSCFVTAQTTLLQSATPIVVAAATHVDQRICGPDGSITIGPNDVTVNGAPDPAHANFVFDWYVGSPTGVPIVSSAGSDILNIGNDPLIGAGDYYVTAARVAGVAVGSGCKSAPLKVTIDDISVKPVINLKAFTNTACDTNYEGKIEVRATDSAPPGAGQPYTYTWDPTNPVAIPTTINNNGNGINDGDGDNPINLKEGTYNVTVKNNATQCSVVGQITLLQSATPVVVANATPISQQICAPDGSITIGPNDVTVNGVADPVHNNFIFDWYAASPVGAPILSGTGIDAINVGNLPTIGSGDYYVIATRGPGLNPGSGCKSAPLKSTIKNITIYPTVGFTTIANTACDNNFDARINVLPATSGGIGAGSNYDLTWTSFAPGSSAANATNVGNPYSTGGADIIGPGSYSLIVKNRTTQCTVVGNVAVVSNPQPVDILAIGKTDQAICYPDGSITVASLNVGTPANYTFNWFKNDPNSTALVDGASATIVSSVLNVGNFPTIGAGIYYVTATKNAGVTPGSGCKTPPFRADILDNHKDPRIAFTFQPNSSCDNLNPNGSVLANAAEQSGANGDTYSFAWTLNGAALPGVTTVATTNNSSQLTNAYEGTYKLSINNVTTTGCSFTSSLPVDLNLNISLPNIIGVNIVDPTDCFPSGSAVVSSVSIGGGPAITGPALTTNFTYEWYANTFAPPSLLPTTTPTIAALSPRSYFVLVQDNATKCKSGPREVQILDDNIIYPVVDIAQTARQISCIATTGTAALAATGDGQTDANPNYNFSWFPSLDGTGVSFASTSAISNLLVGNYSVTVLNTTTGCTATAPYIIPDDAPTFTPQLSLGGQDRTLCVGQDGAVLARVVNQSPLYPFPPNFKSDLYLGQTPNLGGAPDFPNMGNVPGFNVNFIQSNLPEGFYTVRLTDNNTGCFVTGIQEILDKRTPPNVVILEEQPLTICDPVRPNGQLSATADGGKVGGYGFDWYKGSAVASPPGAPILTGNKLIAQGAGSYVVRVTTKLTGCFADKTGNITDKTVKPPIPSPKVVFDRTSCIVPNGWVTVSVGGVIFNYSFDWYDGAAASGGIDYNGVDYRDRDVGPYTVTATDQTTGCVSPPATVNVLDKRVTPEFNLTSTPSYCLDTGKPVGGGSVQLELVTSDVALDDVSWIDLSTNKQIGTGVQVFQLFPGFYKATATTSEGCVNDGTVEVKTEISPYNGMSVNGDSQNDNFIIDCISLFPDNNVKIFNRSGILVYEINGYNNADFSFKGLGEKGAYMLGTLLPVGTYFYVIDKRDGSKPLAGFLELNR